MLSRYYRQPSYFIWMAAFIGLALPASGQQLIWSSGSSRGENLEWHHDQAVNAVTFSRDGKVVATGSEDGLIRIWDVARRIELAKLQGDTFGIQRIAFSPDAKVLVSASSDAKLNVWDLASNRKLHQFDNQSEDVILLEFSSDGQQLFSGASDGIVRIWDMNNGTQVRTFRTAALMGITPQLSSTGNYLVQKHSLDQQIRLYDSKSGDEIKIFDGNTRDMTGVAFSTDDTKLISRHSNGSVTLWDLAGKEIIRKYSGAKVTPSVSGSQSNWAGNTNELDISPDEILVAAVSNRSFIRLWDVATGKDVHRLEGHSGGVNSVTFSPDGSSVVSSSEDATVRLWDVVTGEELIKFNGHEGSVYDAVFSPDGTRVVSGSEDHTVRVWDTSTGEELLQFSGHEGDVLDVAFSIDGLRIASGSEDQTIRIWNVDSEEVGLIRGHTDRVTSVEFSSDGVHLFSGAADGSARTWNVENLTETETFGWYGSKVTSMAIDVDSLHIASGYLNGQVKVWDASKGELLVNINAHSTVVSSLMFLPGRVVSGSAGFKPEHSRGRINSDGEIRIWDVESGSRVSQLVRSPRSTSSTIGLAASEGGTVIASVSSPIFLGMNKVHRDIRGSSDSIYLWGTEKGSTLGTFPPSESEESGQDPIEERDVFGNLQIRSSSRPDMEVNAIDMTPDALNVVLGMQDGTVILWATKVANTDLAFLEQEDDIDITITLNLTDSTGQTTGTVELGFEVEKPATLEEVSVTEAALAPDNVHLATASQEPVIIQIWNTKTGKEVLYLNPESTGGRMVASRLSEFVQIKALAFSPDGKYLASGGSSNSVLLWDLGTAKVAKKFKGHGKDVITLEFSPDSKILASGSNDRTVRLWEVDSGKELHVLAGHKKKVRAVRFSSDGMRLASGGDDKTVRLWDTYSGEQLKLFKDHRDVVRAVALSPDGMRMVTGSDAKLVHLWDVNSGEKLLTMEGHDKEISSVAFSPDGRQIASGSAPVISGLRSLIKAVKSEMKGEAGNKSVRLWDAETGEDISGYIGIVKDHSTSVKFSSNGDVLFSTGLNGFVEKWDLSTEGAAITSGVHQTHLGRVNSVAFSPDGTQLASSSDDLKVLVWDVNNGMVLRTFDGKSSVEFSKDGSRIMSLIGTNIYVWDVMSQRRSHSFRKGWTGSTFAALSPDGASVISGRKKDLILWDIGSEREMKTYEVDSEMTAVAYMPDGNHVIYGMEDGTIVLWDTEAWKAVREFGNQKDRINDVDITQDALYIVSGSKNGSVRIWDISTGEELVVIENGSGVSVNSVHFSPDQSLVLAGTKDGFVRIWDVQSGVETMNFRASEMEINSVQFSPDGQRVVVGSDDATVSVWYIPIPASGQTQ